MIFLVGTYQRCRDWCAYQDPPINPRGRDVVLVTQAEKILGYIIHPDDKVMDLGGLPAREGVEIWARIETQRRVWT